MRKSGLETVEKIMVEVGSRELLTGDDVCRLFGITKYRLRKWKKCGLNTIKIEGYLPLRTHYYRADSIRWFLRCNKQEIISREEIRG